MAGLSWRRMGKGRVAATSAKCLVFVCGPKKQINGLTVPLGLLGMAEEQERRWAPRGLDQD